MFLNKKQLMKYGAIALGLSVGFLFLILREVSFLNIVNAITLSGICFLILALFRTARYLRFYDLPVYGYKKFMEFFRSSGSLEDRVAPYHEYVAALEHPVDFKEAYTVAIVLLAASMIMATAW